MNRLFNKDLWDEIIESISSNGFRTIITAFGVFWGIFILVLLLCASNGFQNGIKGQFEGTSSNSIFIWTQGISKAYNGKPKNRWYNFKLKDVQAIEQNVPGLKTISPRNRLGGWGSSTIISHEENNASLTVEADFPELITQWAMDIQKGRYLNQSDIDLKRKICIIGYGAVDDLFKKNEEVIGSYIKIQGVSFKVVGVYKDATMIGKRNFDLQKKIFVPFTTFSQVFNYGDRVGYFFITGEDGIPIKESKDKILEVLKKQHDIHPDDDRAIGTNGFYKAFEKFEMLFLALKSVSYFVGILILGSGVIGISNIMLIVIKERTKEIGVRRALGAKPSAIRKQILLESLFLTLTSGMAGIAFAAFIAFLANIMIDKIPKQDALLSNVSVDLPTVGIALLILVISGLFAGLIPAQTALKIKPIEALRTD